MKTKKKKCPYCNGTGIMEVEYTDGVKEQFACRVCKPGSFWPKGHGNQDASLLISDDEEGAIALRLLDICLSDKNCPIDQKELLKQMKKEFNNERKSK